MTARAKRAVAKPENAPAATEERAQVTERGAKRFPLEPVMAMAPDAVHTAFLPGWDDEADEFDRDGPLAIVTVNGPLMQRGGWFWDGYEAIRNRLGAALSDPSIGGVALVINSPGGVCAGCFEAVAAMRKMKEAAGKPVFAFADEMAYSAGYAVACVADEIYLPEPGGVGSVGVIGVLFDQSKLNAELGLNVVVVASGDQKADGHPDLPLSEEAIARYRDRTMQLAGIFSALVADARSKDIAEIVGQQAGCFYGRAAVTAGLADGVKSRDQFLSYAQREAKRALTTTNTSARKTMGKTAENAADRGEQAVGEVLVAGPSFSAIALAHGMNHSADEGSIIARASELRSLESKVLTLTGKSSIDEALGAIQAGQLALPQLDAANTQLASLRAEGAKREVEALIDQGKADGKITSPDVERVMRETGAESPTRLRSLLAVMPAVVQARPPADEPLVGVTLTEDELRVARQTGVSPEQLLKTKAENAAAAATAKGGK